MRLPDPRRLAAIGVPFALAVLNSACTTIKVEGGPCTEGGGIRILGTGGHTMSYNETCGAREAAGKLLQIEDAGVKASGILALEKLTPPLKESGNRVREAFVNGGMTQQFKVVRGEDGGLTLVGQPLVTVPVADRPAAVETAASAPVPAPAPVQP